jgi:hypothetical protein
MYYHLSMPTCASINVFVSCSVPLLKIISDYDKFTCTGHDSDHFLWSADMSHLWENHMFLMLGLFKDYINRLNLHQMLLRLLNQGRWYWRGKWHVQCQQSTDKFIWAVLVSPTFTKISRFCPSARGTEMRQKWVTLTPKRERNRLVRDCILSSVINVLWKCLKH